MSSAADRCREDPKVLDWKWPRLVWNFQVSWRPMKLSECTATGYFQILEYHHEVNHSTVMGSLVVSC